MSQSNASSKVRCPFYFFHRLVSRFQTVEGLKAQMETVCQHGYEACAIYRMVMAEKYGGDGACKA